MAEPRLTTVTRTQGANEALKSGAVAPHSFEFAFAEVPVLIQGFRRMVRGLEFDVSEMALTTYLVAKAHGVRFTAVPAFLVRGFYHGAIQRRADSDVTRPKDLEGRRVGVNRGYTVTAGVWARAILQEEYGVDLGKVTWVLSGDEHVADYKAPGNVVANESGHGLEELLLNGELAATIGVDSTSPELTTLIPHPDEAAFEALVQHALYPINHLIVVKDDLLDAHPELGAQVFDAFARAKAVYVDRLRSGTIENPNATDRMYRRVMDLTGADPLPYGIEANRATLEDLMRHAVDQKILERPLPLESLFAESTLGLS